MSDERLDELERQIYDAIRFHREQYEQAIKPLLDRWGEIQSLRPRSFLVSRDQLASFAIQPFVPPPTPSARGSE